MEENVFAGECDYYYSTIYWFGNYWSIEIA